MPFHRHASLAPSSHQYLLSESQLHWTWPLKASGLLFVLHSPKYELISLFLIFLGKLRQDGFFFLKGFHEIKRSYRRNKIQEAKHKPI